jgi:hypothetical protein
MKQNRTVLAAAEADLQCLDDKTSQIDSELLPADPNVFTRVVYRAAVSYKSQMGLLNPLVGYPDRTGRGPSSSNVIRKLP